jgi:hypothetical protein
VAVAVVVALTALRTIAEEPGVEAAGAAEPAYSEAA